MSVRILDGDALTVLRTLPDCSVQCCVTSPPYWRQRDYGVVGQLGLETTPEEYVARLVGIFSEVNRALRDDGTLWLNLGDKWASGGNGGGGSFMAERAEAWTHAKGSKGWRNPPAGYKDKDLVGIPWMAAFALRADGWFLRQCNVWAKPNGMPESVTDRSTVSHEYVFQLSKRNDYYYNSADARTPTPPSSETRLVAPDANGSTLTGAAHGRHVLAEAIPERERRSDKQRGHSRKHQGFNDRWDAMSRVEQMAQGSNLRSVWWVSPAQYAEGHYAVMPNRIAEICITAGSKAGDMILDPFSGAGTTALMADRLNRSAIGIELNPKYAEMARKRITDDSPLFGDVA